MLYIYSLICVVNHSLGVESEQKKDFPILGLHLLRNHEENGFLISDSVLKLFFPGKHLWAEEC